MKRILPIIFSVVSSINTAAAEVVPYGCYVTDAERDWFVTNTGYTVDCYAASDNMYSWTTPAAATREQLVQAYGAFAEVLINDGYNRITACDTAYNRKVALEKKLRRACGSKCKRIK